MKKQIRWLTMATLVFGLCTSAKAQCTGEVYPATVSLTGMVQKALGGRFKGVLTKRHLINLALGLPHTEDPAPPNMVLAVVSNCECAVHTLWLVVWDKSTNAKVATIARAVDVLGDHTYIHTADGAVSGKSVVLWGVQTEGNLNGGYLSSVASYPTPTSGCLTNFTATANGNLNIDAYDPDGNWIVGMDALVLGGTIKADGPMLGTTSMD